MFGKSLHQPIYQLLQHALEKGYTNKDICDLLSVKGKCPHSLINVVKDLPPPQHPSGIVAFFYEQGDEEPDPRQLDSHRKNLMVFDDLMLSKH